MKKKNTSAVFILAALCLLCMNLRAQKHSQLSMSDESEFVEFNRQGKAQEFRFNTDEKISFTQKFYLIDNEDRVEIGLETDSGEFFVILRSQVESDCEKIVAYSTTRRPAVSMQKQAEGYDIDFIYLPMGWAADIYYQTSKGFYKKIILVLLNPHWDRLHQK